MVTYAIGDVQGCSATLRRLHARLVAAGLDEQRDALWLAGDLVNRGPGSLDVLRWALERQRRMGERFVCVLGNHDLHLLALAAGAERGRRGDTLEPVLAAPDRNELLAWLRGRPLLHRAELAGRPHVLVHAGLLPQWSVEQAAALARELEAALASPGGARALRQIRKHKETDWRAGLEGPARLGAIASVLVRLRTCTPEGRPCLEFAGPPEEAPAGCIPWFDVPGRAHRDAVVVCGHWAALGLRLRPDLVALDSGCVWGQALTAVRLEDRAVFSEPNAEPPGDGPAQD